MRSGADETIVDDVGEAAVEVVGELFKGAGVLFSGIELVGERARGQSMAAPGLPGVVSCSPRPSAAAATQQRWAYRRGTENS